MPKPGAEVKRETSFDHAVTELAETHPGVRSAVDNFIVALKLGGTDLPAQRFGRNQHVHLLDDVTKGTAGKSLFGVTYYLTNTSPPTFTLVDIWLREPGLA